MTEPNQIGGIGTPASPAGPAALTGKRIRLRRLIDPLTGSCRIVALDHGMTSPDFLEGLTDTAARVRESVAGGANVLMLGRGIAGSCWEAFAGQAALALMLTAAAAGRPGGATITPISSVEEASRIGADAVVIYVALGGEDEPDMIRYLSRVGEACDSLGIPLIAEAEFPNAYASRDSVDGRYGPAYLRRNARLCAELGADIVKVNWSGDQASFASIVSACGRPVVLAGGPVLQDAELLRRMEQARDAGAIGYSVGRNVFEHPDPEAMTRALTAIFRSGISAVAALKQLQAESKDRSTP
jgi:fructose-bisphosphate aldolase / 2-amino-3,7-dideoxy-D-threo-hept-6-ulosonate synthase